MKSFLKLLAIGLVAVTATSVTTGDALAQSRDFKTQRLILDDGNNTGKLTISYEGPGDAEFVIPPGPATTVEPGTLAGQTLRWDGAEWLASSSLQNDGLNITIPVGHLDLTLGNLTLGAGTITGNGSGITAINASNVATGTLSDARLSSNVPLKNTANTFTNTNTFEGTTNVGTINGTTFNGGTFNGTFVGDGAGVTDLNATEVTTGTLDIARISTSGAADGEVLTYTGGVLDYAVPTAGSLVLPFSQTQESPGVLFHLTNNNSTFPSAGVARFTVSETGMSGTAVIAETSGTGNAVDASTYGGGTAIRGLSQGQGFAGSFQNNGGGSTPTLQSVNANGSGVAGRFVASGTGSAGEFVINNAGNTTAALTASTTGTGDAIAASGGDITLTGGVYNGDGSGLTNVAAASLTLPFEATASDGDALFSITNTGNPPSPQAPIAGYFAISNPSATGHAVYAINSGTGNGITVTTASGRGILSNTQTGTAGYFWNDAPSNIKPTIYARQDGTGNAIEAEGGDITLTDGVYNGNGSGLTNVTADELMLPFTQSGDVNGPLFEIINTRGSLSYPSAARFVLTEQSLGVALDVVTEGNADGLRVITEAGGDGIYANAIDGGTAGYFQTEGTDDAPTLLVYNGNGTGYAGEFVAYGTGTAGRFHIHNDLNPSDVLRVTTNGTGNTITASGGDITLTGGVYNGDGSGLTNVAASSLTLPFTGNSTNNGTLFYIRNNNVAEGIAGTFEITQAGNNSAALRALSSGTGNAFEAMSGNASPTMSVSNGGSGNAAEFYSNGASPTIYASNEAISDGSAAQFNIAEATNSAAALIATTIGSGNGGVFTVNNTSSSASALLGTTNGDIASIGVHGIADDGFGISGESTNGIGVRGESSVMYGVYGTANGFAASAGVYGENTGGGNGVTGVAVNGYGVRGIATTGTGVYSTSTLGHAGIFETTNASNTTSAVEIATNGTSSTSNGLNVAASAGTAIQAISSTGKSGFFQNTNAANASTTLLAQTNGNGYAGQFTASGASTTGAAVRAESNGAAASRAVDAIATFGTAVRGESIVGTGIYGMSNAGRAGHFQITSTTNATNAVEVSTLGNASSVGVRATADDGVAIYGTSTNNTGVYGTSSNGIGGRFSGLIGLQVDNGSLIASSITVSSGNAIPVNVMAVHIISDGTGAAATSTAPAGAEGKILFISTDDPEGVTISGYTIMGTGTLMYMNGAWRGPF